jgi:hypothetical protein
MANHCPPRPLHTPTGPTLHEPQLDSLRRPDSDTVSIDEPRTSKGPVYSKIVSLVTDLARILAQCGWAYETAERGPNVHLLQSSILMLPLKSDNGNSRRDPRGPT